MENTPISIFRPSEKEQHKLSLFSTNVQAGFPSQADDHIERTLDLNELIIKHPAATFFVRVEGRSMENAGIFPGDILVVDRSLTPLSENIVIAIIDSEFTVKKILFKEGQIYLLPQNPSYSPIKIEEGMDFQVFGVVTYVIHKAL